MAHALVGNLGDFKKNLQPGACFRVLKDRRNRLNDSFYRKERKLCERYYPFYC